MAATKGVRFATTVGVTREFAVAHYLTMKSSLAIRVFAHRVAQNGSIESFCMGCFLPVFRTGTVGKLSEGGLLEVESAHACGAKTEDGAQGLVT